MTQHLKTFNKKLASFFLLTCFLYPKVDSFVMSCVHSHSVVSNSCDPIDCSPPGPSDHGATPGKNGRVGCHALLHGIFPTQGLNPGLLHCRRILYHLNHQGSSFVVSSYHNNKLISLHSSLFMSRVSDCVFVCVEGKDRASEC